MRAFAQRTIVPFLLVIIGFASCERWYEAKLTHRMPELDSHTFEMLAGAGKLVNFEPILDSLLVPRVSGTDGNVVVRKYISDYMTNLGWDVEKDAFEDTTPLGVKSFENIITTLNPTVTRRLVLACHYDSKYEEKYVFLGATDSAVPCAQLLHLASTMKSLLDSHKNNAQDVTLQFIFFDGEESFVKWSPKDSTYGSRHLAAKWEAMPYSQENSAKTTALNRMDMMVLLDLLGAADPQLHNYFRETSWWFGTMEQSERQLMRSGLWAGSSSYFKGLHPGRIEDDHLPFLARGVSIMHLIASPFPKVWHTQADDRSALDFDTIENLSKVFRLFVARYLRLVAP